MEYPVEGIPVVVHPLKAYKAEEHVWTDFRKRNYYVYCKEQGED
jgi:hypothetical protein